MKYLFLSITTIILCSINLRAQSLIVTSDNQPITGYDVTVTENGIFYRTSESAESQFIKIDRDKVLLVRHKDGSVVDFTEHNNAGDSTPTQNVITADSQAPISPNDYLDHEYNKKEIERYNTPMTVTFQKESDKNKKVYSIAYQYYVTEDSQFASTDLNVSCHIWTVRNKYSGIPVGTRFLSVTLKNTSDKTIYIDLANTFYIINGQSRPYYVPSAVSSTSSGTTGVSVNLGSVARAVGVGRTVGAIAGGVNVGGAKTNSSTNITYSQRVISIPPNSTQKLEDKEIVLRNLQHYCSDINRVGNFAQWEESTSPYKFSIFTTYSLSEDFTEKYTLSSTRYVKSAVGIAGPNYDLMQITYKKGESIKSDPRIKVNRAAGFTVDVAFPYRR